MIWKVEDTSSQNVAWWEWIKSWWEWLWVETEFCKKYFEGNGVDILHGT